LREFTLDSFPFLTILALDNYCTYVKGTDNLAVKKYLHRIRKSTKQRT